MCYTLVTQQWKAFAAMGIEYRCDVAETPSEVLRHLPAWRRARGQFLDDNFYESPEFVLAAIQHYGHRLAYKIVFIYEFDGASSTLIAVAPFSVHPPSPQIPLTTLSTLATPHGYLSHPLLRVDRSARAAQVLWRWVERPEHPWSLVVLQQMNKHSHVWSVLRRELNQSGRQHQARATYQRAVLRRRESFDSYMQSLSKSRRGKYRRSWRLMERAGEFKSILHRNLESCPDLAWRFMELEKLSWKGRAGTAMVASKEDRRFFNDIVEYSANHNNLFFVELRLNGEPIAISSNFVMGSTLFGFKIAYHPGFGQFSPGIMAELETIRRFHDTADLLQGDGGTSGNSFLDDLWQDHTTMASVHVATGRLSSLVYHEVLPWAATMKTGAAHLLGRIRRTRQAYTKVS